MNRLPTFIFVIILLTTMTEPVSAHGEGGVLRISDRSVGTYLLHAWTSPGIPRIGEAHLEALITTPDGDPVVGCQVTMIIEAANEDADDTMAQLKSRQVIYASEALASNQFRHEGIATIETSGHYVVNIIVSENGKKIGQSAFTVEVLPVPQWIEWGLNGLLLGLAASGFWFGHKGLLLARKTS